MSIAIKSIPVLKKKAADAFTKKVVANSVNKHSINFAKQVNTASKILAKAKI